ncbi:MAG: FkbM family methyltransferase [Acetobacteraceae bacterium]|nr:FkbM family methyltransferase [Acetobacteraceae bacterium]
MAKDCVSVGGIQIAIDPRVMSPRMLEVIRSGDYERPEAYLLPSILQPGERVVELGAGVGYISALCARHTGVESVAVYEANPHLIPLIKRTHALNGVRCSVENAVVVSGESGGTRTFYLRDDFWASSLSPGPYGYRETVEVPVVGLSDVLARHRPTMLIIDIEGGEVELCRDVALPGVKKVFIEVHQNIIGRNGMKSIFQFFLERDFHYDQWHSSHGVILFSHVDR